MNLRGALESMLFVSGEPIAVGKLSKLLGCEERTIEEMLDILEKEYLEKKGGFAILRTDGSVQLATNPDCAEYVRKLAKGEMSRNLSQSVMETLSIIAYRGPVSRGDVEAIRGVNSSFALRHLLMRGLVDRYESEEDSRIYLYKPAFAFLKSLGIRSLSDLPDYDSLSKDSRLDATRDDSSKND